MPPRVQNSNNINVVPLGNNLGCQPTRTVPATKRSDPPPRTGLNNSPVSPPPSFTEQETGSSDFDQDEECKGFGNDWVPKFEDITFTDEIPLGRFNDLKSTIHKGKFTIYREQDSREDTQIYLAYNMGDRVEKLMITLALLDTKDGEIEDEVGLIASIEEFAKGILAEGPEVNRGEKPEAYVPPVNRDRKPPPLPENYVEVHVNAKGTGWCVRSGTDISNTVFMRAKTDQTFPDIKLEKNPTYASASDMMPRRPQDLTLTGFEWERNPTYATSSTMPRLAQKRATKHNDESLNKNNVFIQNAIEDKVLGFVQKSQKTLELSDEAGDKAKITYHRETGSFELEKGKQLSESFKDYLHALSVKKDYVPGALSYEAESAYVQLQPTGAQQNNEYQLPQDAL